MGWQLGRVLTESHYVSPIKETRFNLVNTLLPGPYSMRVFARADTRSGSWGATLARAEFPAFMVLPTQIAQGE